MEELAREYIGKECLIYTINNTLDATIERVTDGAILVKSKNGDEIVNIDFITRICEYPRNKNGKKKAIVF